MLGKGEEKLQYKIELVECISIEYKDIYRNSGSEKVFGVLRMLWGILAKRRKLLLRNEILMS